VALPYGGGEMSVTVHETRDDPLRVLIAGAGVAGLETALALHALAPGLVGVELLAPEREFVYRPLSVAEPFGLAGVKRFDIDQIAAEAGATVHARHLTGIDSDRHVALTNSGDAFDYDVAVIATGARPQEAVPGALTFVGGPSGEDLARVLEELESGAASSVAFAVPQGMTWSLPIYELALMTAGRLHDRGLRHRKLTVVTPEEAPLALFGDRASEELTRLLRRDGIRFVGPAVAESFTDGRLLLAGGGSIEADRAVALPTLEVPSIRGVQQGSHGFIPTDPFGRVEGLADVFAVGDASWFPIKQGGIAAQQADLAAEAIAARAGAKVDPAAAPLILRGALLTGGAPRFLSRDSSGVSRASTAALWWPPGKIAGRYLAPLLARLSRDELPAPPLADLDQLFDSDPKAAEAGHREALSLALSAADAEASWGDTGSALRWLDIAEQLNVALPPQYLERRARWREELVAR
jgi:sulfide:quinone oxidoreductase